jgi:uncharacterized protein (TIGR03085 family)
MAAPSPARSERLALCDLFDEVGPDAPTLDEGWTTFDLAAHLTVRERNPIAGVGILVPAAAHLHDAAIEKLKAGRSYADVVRRLREPFGLFRLLDAQINLHEWFVHHEDVRRGGGDTTPRPVDEIAETEAAIWTMLSRGHRMLTRKVRGVHLDLVDSRHPDDVIHCGGHGDTVRVVGRPGEVLLFLFGRSEAAHVELVGDDSAVAVLEACDLGI